MTLAILDGGTSYHHHAIHGERFRSRFDRVIYAPDLETADLSGMNALIVADRVNPSILRRKRRILIDYVASGGTLIVFGETQAHSWAPGVEWSFRPTNFWWWLDRGADPGHRVLAPEHEIFSHLEPSDVVWHYHGLLTPPPGALPLVVIEAPGETVGRNCILYDHPDVGIAGGRMIVMTLDPFYHHGSRFMPAATRFLDRFLAWTDMRFRAAMPG